MPSNLDLRVRVSQRRERNWLETSFWIRSARIVHDKPEKAQRNVLRQETSPFVDKGIGTVPPLIAAILREINHEGTNSLTIIPKGNLINHRWGTRFYLLFVIHTYKVKIIPKNIKIGQSLSAGNKAAKATVLPLYFFSANSMGSIRESLILNAYFA